MNMKDPTQERIDQTIIEPQSQANLFQKHQNTYKLLTFNMFLRPPLIKNNQDDMKNERLSLLLDKIEDYDILCLQEVHTKHKLIYNSLKKGFLYHAESDDPTFLDGTLVDGGLLTLSKKPIVYSKFQRFQYGVLSDNIALKGILYTKILIKQDKQNQNYYLHLFNTHLQASYIGHETKVKSTVLTRINQLKTLKAFVDVMLAQNYSSDKDLCLIVGDYNVNALCDGLPISYLEKSKYSYYILSNNGKSQITYGDTVKDQHGKEVLDRNKNQIPKETVLTDNEDFCSKQCLDYIMVYKPGTLLGSEQQSFQSKNQNNNDEDYNQNQTQQPQNQNKNRKQSLHDIQNQKYLRYKDHSTKVQPFFVQEYYRKQNITVTQISDHYALECEIEYYKPYKDRKNLENNATLQEIK
ncbi:Endonuclease/exonuclease/phosphatase [Pseudocohnilembus persalinus]|uniref:sphingomyelin phosphodiesterase n=1 Tax=Pseudocohnilembus persalinus TaxID=266149 RepID=A0A0V0R689_PSEPJ|nr:Endonuclease/exonuclease/phosphatase [Pseudocohnilembus persalinus]|eukprot:KRX10020.1 Endonuclease/exonuclease/phosphatase [Pseudocohnilembus persalinus]